MRRTTYLDPSTSIESPPATPKAVQRTAFLGGLSSQVQQGKLALPLPLRKADFYLHTFTDVKAIPKLMMGFSRQLRQVLPEACQIPVVTRYISRHI